jgi:hypothetical protein
LFVIGRLLVWWSGEWEVVDEQDLGDSKQEGTGCGWKKEAFLRRVCPVTVTMCGGEIGVR